MLRKIIIQSKKNQQMSLFAAKLGTFFHVTNNLAIYFLLKHDFVQTFYA